MQERFHQREHQSRLFSHLVTSLSISTECRSYAVRTSSSSKIVTFKLRLLSILVFFPLGPKEEASLTSLQYSLCPLNPAATHLPLGFFFFFFSFILGLKYLEYFTFVVASLWIRKHTSSHFLKYRVDLASSISFSLYFFYCQMSLKGISNLALLAQ